MVANNGQFKENIDEHVQSNAGVQIDFENTNTQEEQVKQQNSNIGDFSNMSYGASIGNFVGGIPGSLIGGTIGYIVGNSSDNSKTVQNINSQPNTNATNDEKSQLTEKLNKGVQKGLELYNAIQNYLTFPNVPIPETWEKTGENKVTINKAEDNDDGLYIDDQSGNKILKTEAWKDNADKSTTNYSQRVSLNVAPINKEKNVSNLLSKDEWEARLGYILGGNVQVVGEYGPILPYYQGGGLLYELFGPTRGIVFPYTPDIDFNHQVNYEETSIPHSNLNVQHYKNTPPPAISLTADFTADNENNARYMYGVIHFLRSISKCEFGEEVVKSRNNVAGVPPPTLYLNGWGNLINNVPVVVKSFGIKLGKEKHYVHLNDLDIWLPTDISIIIQMGIQFNLDKYKMKFDLNAYKKGILGTDKESNYANYDTYNVVHSENINETYKNNLTKEEKTITKKIYTTQTVHSVRRFNGSGWTW